ncbi:MAG: glycosyltransferase family 2 protein [Coriobacteriia bacterium]|nr:glycosyltransferase family 2 protein [Coriobacteriia bacterium]
MKAAQHKESHPGLWADSSLTIGIAIPAYNASAFLDRTISSIENQTDEYWRLVVVDDGSTDDSLEILSQFAEKDPRITVIHQENGGTASALNTGLCALQTEWVAYLGADDEFTPDYVETMRTTIEQIPDSLFYACNLQIISPQKTMLMSDSQKIISYDLDAYLRKIPFSFAGAVAKKSLYEQIGYFDESEYAEDLDLLLRILILGEKGIQIPEALFICHQEHEDRKSGNLMPQYKSEVKIFGRFLDEHTDQLTGNQIHSLCQEIIRITEVIASRDPKITALETTDGYRSSRTVSADAPHWKQAFYHLAATFLGEKRASAFAQRIKRS